MLIVFGVEISLVIVHSSEKKMIQDIKSNFLLGLLYLITGLSIKGVAFGVYAVFYHFAIFKPGPSWWLWVLGFMGCEFCHTTTIGWDIGPEFSGHLMSHTIHRSTSTSLPDFAIIFYTYFIGFYFGPHFAFWEFLLK